MTVTETEVVKGIGSDYEVKYGFSVPEDYFFKSGRGLSHELVDAISSHKDEPDWMRKFRPGAWTTSTRARCRRGAGTLRRSTSRTSTTTSAPRRSSQPRGRTTRRHQRHVDKLGIPEAEKKYLAGVGAQYESEVVYHKLKGELGARASSSSTWTPASASTRTSSASTSGRSSRRTTTSSRR